MTWKGMPQHSLRTPVLRARVTAVVCCALHGNAAARPMATPTAKEIVAENDRAREFFRLGVNAMKAGRFVEARQFLTQAWQLRQTYDVAASLAQVESELGHRARAASLLDFCMKNFAPIESDRNYQQIAQAFDDVRRQVGNIDLSELPNGADVRVDGDSMGTTPLALPLYLEPGTHELVLQVGAGIVERRIVVQAGVRQQIPMDTSTLIPAEAKPTAGRVTIISGAVVSGRADPLAARPTFPYYVGATLALSGLAFGVANQLEARDAGDRAAHETGCNVTDGARPDACQKAAVANAEHSYYQNLAWFGFGTAATAAISTALYWLWPEAGPTRTHSAMGTTWTVGCAPTEVWLGATGVVP